MRTSALASITVGIAIRGFVMIHGWMVTGGTTDRVAIATAGSTFIRRGAGGRPTRTKRFLLGFWHRAKIGARVSVNLIQTHNE